MGKKVQQLTVLLILVTAFAFGADRVPEGMVLIPAGTNSGTNPLAAGKSYDASWYPASYSLTVDAFYMDKYEVTKVRHGTKCGRGRRAMVTLICTKAAARAQRIPCIRSRGTTW